MKNVIFCLLLLLLLFPARGQNTEQATRLKIGDTIANKSLGLFENQPYKQFFISDYKGKLVILDFWNIRCAACLKAMPYMDSLQKMFQKKLQIILVTENTSQEVEKLFSRIKFKKPDLPLITDDHILNEYFPHMGDPFHVWIGPNGRIQQITSGYNATKKNIETSIKGISLNLGERAQLVDSGQSILADANAYLKKYICYNSILVSGYHEISKRFEKLQKNENHKKIETIISIRNASILQLYTYLYSKMIYGFELSKNNRVLVQVKNRSSLTMPLKKSKIDEWKKNHLFSYELTVPVFKDSLKYKWMLEDLNRYFPYSGKIQTKKITCWVITKKNAFQLKNTSNSAPSISYSMKGFHMKNKPISDFIKKIILLSQYSNNDPIIDNTHYKKNMDLDLNCVLTDMPSLKKELNRYGLRLKKDKKAIEVLVIRDK